MVQTMKFPVQRSPMPMKYRIVILISLLVSGMMLLSGCGIKRNALPADAEGKVVVMDFDAIRFYGDTSPDNLKSSMAQWYERYSKTPHGEKITMLSLSGGGANGAFGAGFLVGWTSTMTRPQFDMVTGVSTGALFAPFAFLGPEYDAVIKLLYTSYSTDMLIERRSIGYALSGDSIYSTRLMRQVMQNFYSDRIIDAIAREYRKGRILLIGTTNLDEMRPVYWDIGAIAQYGTEEAYQLVRDVILASAAIPVAFPPVYIKVRNNGYEYDEMHVDGGVTNQVFSYPPSIRLRDELRKMGEKRNVSLYVIRNDALRSKRTVVEPRIADIATRSLMGLIRNQGIGDLYRIYYTAKRDGISFHLAVIPPDVNQKTDELFSPEYMKKLFDIGRSKAMGDNPWLEELPHDLVRSAY